jgi:hypothetical protein
MLRIMTLRLDLFTDFGGLSVLEQREIFLTSLPVFQNQFVKLGLLILETERAEATNSTIINRTNIVHFQWI